MMQRKPPVGFNEDESGITKYGAASSWYELVGPLYHAADNEPGLIRMGFYSEPRYISSMGRVHGGMMSSFMDYLLFNSAHSAWGETMLATVSLNINFVSACPANVWVLGHGRVIHAGNSTAFVTGEAWASDKVVAQATGTFKKVGNRPS